MNLLQKWLFSRLMSLPGLLLLTDYSVPCVQHAFDRSSSGSETRRTSQGWGNYCMLLRLTLISILIEAFPAPALLRMLWRVLQQVLLNDLVFRVDCLDDEWRTRLTDVNPQVDHLRFLRCWGKDASVPSLSGAWPRTRTSCILEFDKSLWLLNNSFH